MTPERLRRIEELYHSARESGAAVLADADPELRRAVEKLLSQDSESGGKLLDQPAADLILRMSEPQVEVGSVLGPYKIEALLGEGGMGQVFRACDTRLGRTVAIKISSERFSNRFEHESRVIAALNHPNICTLHDVGPNYLVMELIEGETLAARIKRGKLSVEQALQLASQIAGALAAAHAKGIIHRDLKPANVMLTKSGVKVLDFGLAKSATDPTLTAEGLRMGTPAYMAPEQFEGNNVDPRIDIYALGLILREMLTGKRGEFDETTPSSLTRIVKRCLEQDPQERWQSAQDLKWELESFSAAPQPVSPRPPKWTFLTAGLVLLLAAILAYLHFSQTPPRQELARMTVLLPKKSRPLFLAVSPDGRTFAVVLVKEGRQQIWVRALDSLELMPLQGTDGATNPFWSPDGRSVAFFADAKLKRVDPSGGPVQTLCDALAALGGSWNQNGDIIFGALGGLQRVSAAGGPVSDFPSHPTGTELYPFFLPDGIHYLAFRSPGSGSTQSGIWVGSIRGSELRHVLPDASNPQFMGPPPGSSIGAVVFTRGETLMALPFDTKRLEAAGDPFPIAHGIGSRAQYHLAAASNAGVLAYVSGQGDPWQYVWRDRHGKKLGTYPDAGGVAMISPDGKRLAGDWAGQTWVTNLGTGVTTQLTFGSPGNFNPIWSPDGQYVAYYKIGVGLYRKPATGAGEEELLVASKNLAVPKSWSPDGKFIVYAQINPGTGADLMAIPVDGDRKPFPLVQTTATEDQGQFSPDGHWLAYTSNESGQGEIYVIPFPPASKGGKWLVSRGGGVQPRWRRNGKELFYISPDSKMMAVDVGTGAVFQSGTPHPLFDSDIVDTGIRTGPMSWDTSPDGNRFLIISPQSSDSDTSSLTVVLNWHIQDK